MAIVFNKLAYSTPCPPTAYNSIYLVPNNWDDYSYKTLFTLYLFDKNGKRHELGNTKIGYVNQPIGWTDDEIPSNFHELNNQFFSLGQDSDFYKKIYELRIETGFTVEEILDPIRDVSLNEKYLRAAEQTEVYRTSLLRTIEPSSIRQQFRRLLQGEEPWSQYSFVYKRELRDNFSEIKLEFHTEQDSQPPTNIHILIGRNGVGKTTILNNMVNALLTDPSHEEQFGVFLDITPSRFFRKPAPIHEDYFTGVVSVSFSAFDPFLPPDDRTDKNDGIGYRYIGLKIKTEHNEWRIKNNTDLGEDCANSLKLCLALESKRKRWLDAVETLKSDPNFSEMPLNELVERFDSDTTERKTKFEEEAKQFFSRMSSGHSIVLLTITSLIETVEAKTLVLIDEPESHLHPPLLSAFTRALSKLLKNRNGVAIVATHSPVVLQEVPKSCVSIINRTRLISRVDRPNLETFGENVGVLTREVFELEVRKSGFHNLLENSVKQGLSYDDILAKYKHQLGFEGKALLRAMIANKSDFGSEL